MNHEELTDRVRGGRVAGDEVAHDENMHDANPRQSTIMPPLESPSPNLRHSTSLVPSTTSSPQTKVTDDNNLTPAAEPLPSVQDDHPSLSPNNAVAVGATASLHTSSLGPRGGKGPGPCSSSGSVASPPVHSTPIVPPPSLLGDTNNDSPQPAPLTSSTHSQHPPPAPSQQPASTHPGTITEGASSLHEDKMPFGWGKRKGKTNSNGVLSTPPRISYAHRARNLANTNALTNYEADLTSKDRAVQKEAVRRYLAERVRDDWTWPPPIEENGQEPETSHDPPPNSVDSDHRLQTEQSLGDTSVLKNGEDKTIDSPLSGSEHGPIPTSTGPLPGDLSLSQQQAKGNENPSSPSNSLSPDVTAVSGATETQQSIRKAQEDLSDPQHALDEGEWREREDWSYSSDNDSRSSKSETSPNKISMSPRSPTTNHRTKLLEQRRRRMAKSKEEMAWNTGLRTFTERRDAWTGARPITRFRTTAQTSSSHSESNDINNGDESEWEDTEIPIVPPLLPADNPMRAHITPAAYNTIYDKVIAQQMTPSCPINLKDVIGSCLVGWKRDGTWEPTAAVGTKRTGTFSSVFGLQDKAVTRPKPRIPEQRFVSAEVASPGGGVIKRSLDKMMRKLS